MKVGIYLTNQHPPGTDMVSALEEQLVMVRAARDRGWDAVATGQHYLSEGMSQLQLVPFLSRLSAEAGEMTGIAGVLLLSLHHPVEVAEHVASLDIIWKGNFVFGVGLGYREVEFDAFRVPRGQRVRRFEECLALVKRLWTEEAVSFENDLCKLDKVTLTIRPVQQPHPPIWFAATTDRAVERAARLGDTWFIGPHATLPTVTRQMALCQAELSHCGKLSPRELPILREVFCARDRRTALEIAGPHLANKYGAYARWGQDEALPGKETFRRPFEDLARDRFILGSPAECYEQLRPYWETAGINYLILRTHWSGLPLHAALQSMRLISDELLPALHRVQGISAGSSPHSGRRGEA
jgi:alkanesulfonate monooxygenase SsuD/methylene tetrahydromethanopterin reductase-like flavin-dependent oxidoreductase (luciferase family)